MIQNEINSGFVKIISIRGKYGIQGSSYDDCISKNRNKYDFLLFFDFDEFLHIPSNYTINSLLSHPRYNNCDVIKINWLCYGDNGLIYYNNESLKKRFTKVANVVFFNSQIKSIIKINNKSNIIWGNRGAHRPLVNVKNSCDSLGNPVGKDVWQINPPQYRFIYLDHYFTKSSEEFAKRFVRGVASYLKEYNKTKYYERLLDTYFDINNFSLHKLSIFEKKINASLKEYIKERYLKLKD